jgi:hypothetical protein
MGATTNQIISNIRMATESKIKAYVDKNNLSAIDILKHMECVSVGRVETYMYKKKPFLKTKIEFNIDKDSPQFLLEDIE